MKKRIGYLGPPGTFSELAASRYLGDSGNFDIIPLPALADIFLGVERGELEEGILPLENSTEGSVNQTLDLLAHRFTQVKIKGEIILPVTHHLLVRPGVSLNELEQVISHPQALAQCRLFLERFLPQAEIKEAVSTAEAAALIARTSAPWAAIGTALVAQSHGLVVLAEDINDYPDNATRFIIISQKDTPEGPGCKTSLIFSVLDRPGALCNVLLEFSKREIDLTRIESRPTRNRLGEYLFFVDFKGHRLEGIIREALMAIAKHVIDLRVLGSYPIDGKYSPRSAPAPLSQLSQLRAEVDQLDDQIVKLLGQRTRIVKKIGELKKKGKIRNSCREEEIIYRLRKIAREQGMDEQIIERIYHLLFGYYVSLQTVKQDS